MAYDYALRKIMGKTLAKAAVDDALSRAADPALKSNLTEIKTRLMQ
jgi:hypothetical protein